MSQRQVLKASSIASHLITILIIILLSNTSGSREDESDNLQIDIDENLRALYSGETLLENQSHQLEILELNDTMSLIVPAANIRSLDDYERRLRDRAVRLAGIESQLAREWPKLEIHERVDKTRKLEDQLRQQAIHLYDFQAHLKKNYCRLTVSDQEKFLASFEDLLERESELLGGFEYFAHHLQDAPGIDQIEFLASFEDLIRRQAILLDIYNDILKTRCEGLKLNKYVKRCGKFRCGQNITYYYVLMSTCNCTIKDIRILDDRLGYVAEGISLGPYEKRIFEKSTTLNYPSGKRVCNTAYAFAVDSDGLTISSAGDKVCIKIAEPVQDRNLDSINLGDQKTIAVARDPAIAENSITIKKNQNKEGRSNNDALNQDSISVGDQLAGAYHDSRASNRIKIASNQE